MGKCHVSGNAWCKLCVSTNCKFNYLLSVVWFIYVIVPPPTGFASPHLIHYFLQSIKCSHPMASRSMQWLYQGEWQTDKQTDRQRDHTIDHD